MTAQKKRATSPKSGGPTEAFTASTDSTTIKLDAIDSEALSQVRCVTDYDTIIRYIACSGLPPIDVFRVPDNEKLIVADGWHRFDAAKDRGDKTIQAHIHTGTLDEAKVFAIRANSRHGLPLNRHDRDKAIAFLNELGWSARKIGSELGCDHKTVTAALKLKDVQRDIVGKFPALAGELSACEFRAIGKAPKEYWADLAFNYYSAFVTGEDEIEEAVQVLNSDAGEHEKAAALLLVKLTDSVAKPIFTSKLTDAPPVC